MEMVGKIGSSMAISGSALDAILMHARDAAPLECCGLLLGSPFRISCARRARNLEVDPSRFLIDPADHFEAIRVAHRSDQAVIGFYHSHPRSSAEPSESDVAEATDAGSIYVIASLTQNPPEVRGFRLEGGRFLEIPLYAEAEG